MRCDPVRKVLVAGAGASGMCAAIHAARAGALVTILEKTDTAGRKLSMTGNGRCNLSNMELSADSYNTSDEDGVDRYLRRFGTRQTQEFFMSVGVLTRDENGPIYPASGQASAVTGALVSECIRDGVKFIYKEQIKSVRKNDDGSLIVRSDKHEYESDSLILATGGLSGPKPTASTGDGYYICEQLGMKCTDRYPALVSLNCSDDTLPGETGVRVKADITFMSGGEKIASEYGELQITGDGISGIPVMQASGAVASYLDNNKQVTAYADVFPEYTDSEFEELTQRLVTCKGKRTLLDFVNGFANGYLGMTVLKRLGLSPEEDMNSLSWEKLYELVMYYRRIPFEITGTGGYRRAQVTSGGVSLSCLDDDLQSRSFPGVYCVGELVDVDGRCGGYNLQWAWCSAALAGSAAAGKKYDQA